MIKSIEECKKYFNEYRYIKNTLDKYILYENTVGLNKTDIEILKELKTEYEKKYGEIKNFIDRIEDLYIKELFCMRYISGYSWAKIAVLLGGIGTKDCYRKTLTRFLQKFFDTL